ncbi:MAG TPA: hypothetical protein VK524_29290 [Polyangiaceae bacterium]|nr:hypothetical protein [Polyangiaceae bacterium]
MDPVVDLAPGTERSALARRLADVVRTNLGRDWQRREFQRLRGSVVILADDAVSALTLRFDFGRLTIHEGLIGVPDITISGSSADIEALTRMRFDGPLRLPLPGFRDAEGRAALGSVLRALRRRDLKIYGLMLNGRFIVRLLRVLSSSG